MKQLAFGFIPLALILHGSASGEVKVLTIVKNFKFYIETDFYSQKSHLLKRICELSLDSVSGRCFLLLVDQHLGNPHFANKTIHCHVNVYNQLLRLQLKHKLEFGLDSESDRCFLLVLDKHLGKILFINKTIHCHAIVHTQPLKARSLQCLFHLGRLCCRRKNLLWQNF